MGRSFGARLRSALAARGSLCVGIDPSPALLIAWGLEDSTAGLERFCRTVLAAVGDVAAVVKPQSAFFERLGSGGVAVLESLIADARAMGAIVLLDVKRGDVASTMSAYADAYLDPASPLAADAVTAAPYLGMASLRPMIETALAHDAGVFVLSRTSNPGGASVQGAVAADGRAVGETILHAVADLNRGADPLGSIGVVLGATLPSVDDAVGELNGPILAPGVGAQGAGPDDLRRLFARVGRDVIPSASRGLLATGPDKSRLRAATLRLVEECTESLTGTTGRPLPAQA